MATETVEFFEELRAGSQAAWARFVTRYENLVLSVPLRMGLSREDAEEVFQQTWMTLHRNLGHIREPGSLVSWILTTAGREAWRLQRLRRRQQADAGVGEEAAEAELPPEALERLERIQAVRDAVERLPKNCRELLTRLDLAPGKTSYAQVAAELELPVGSVGPTRMRCLARLARLLTQREG